MRSQILSKQLNDIVNTTKNYSTLVIINIKKVPAQLQKNIRAKLPGYSKVVKKAIANRILELRKASYRVDHPTLLIFTNLTPYEVEKILREETLSISAKAGQIAENDIIVEETDTNIPPGPSLSVLKQAGLDARVDKGKIKIAKTTTLVKAGSIITSNQAQALQLLGIKPFKIRAKIAYAHDGETEFNSHVFEIALEQVILDIETSISQSINLAINSNYVNSLTIDKIIIKAINEAVNLASNAGYYSKISIENIIYKNILLGYYIKGDKNE